MRNRQSFGCRECVLWTRRDVFLPGGRDEDYAAERAVFPVERACCCGQEYHTGKDTKSENDSGRENVGGKLKML